VHEANWNQTNLVRSEEESKLWENLFSVRAAAMNELEKARQTKRIGKALDAKLICVGPSPKLASAAQYNSEARELLNISQLVINPVDAQKDVNPSVLLFEGGHLTAVPADGQKCERCWHWETDLGQNAEHPTLCGRCVEAVKQFQA